MQRIEGNFIYLKIYYLQLFNLHRRDNMNRCLKKTQDEIGGGEEKKIKQENTEDDEEEFISLSPWGEEDIEKDKLKKEISKWERVKKDNEDWIKRKEESIKDNKDDLVTRREELPKYYKKIKEKNLHAACINKDEIGIETFKKKLDLCKREVSIQEEKMDQMDTIMDAMRYEYHEYPMYGSDWDEADMMERPDDWEKTPPSSPPSSFLGEDDI